MIGMCARNHITCTKTKAWMSTPLVRSPDSGSICNLDKKRQKLTKFDHKSCIVRLGKYRVVKSTFNSQSLFLVQVVVDHSAELFHPGRHVLLAASTKEVS